MSSVYATKLRVGTINQMARQAFEEPKVYKWARGIWTYLKPPDFDLISMPDDPLCCIKIYIGLDLPGYEWGTYAIEAGITMNGAEFNSPDFRGWYPFIRKGFNDFWKSDMILQNRDPVYGKNRFAINLKAEDVAEGNENVLSFIIDNEARNARTEMGRKYLRNSGGSLLDCYRVKYVFEIQHGTDPDNVSISDDQSIPQKWAQFSMVCYELDTEDPFSWGWPLAPLTVHGGENGLYLGFPQITYVDENGNTCYCNQSGRTIYYNWMQGWEYCIMQHIHTN